jgi:hypothetical protein
MQPTLFKGEVALKRSRGALRRYVTLVTVTAQVCRPAGVSQHQNAAALLRFKRCRP